MVGYSEVRVRSRGYKEVEIVEMKMRNENTMCNGGGRWAGTS